MNQQLCEYHYKHREVRVEHNYPLYPSSPPIPPSPPPPPPPTQKVHYIRVEVEKPKILPPPKKKVVFIEVEKPPPPPPPPKERLVYIRVERPPPPPRPLHEEIMSVSCGCNDDFSPPMSDLSTEISLLKSPTTTRSSVTEEVPKITKYRLVENSDLMKIRRLVRSRTLDVFPNATSFEVIYEKARLSLIQENERNEVVSAIFLANHPNVPSLSQADWLAWMHKLYGMEKSTETNTLFVHFLVWDDRYAESFPRKLLKATFYTARFCNYVIMIQPPGITTVDPIHEEMTRILPKTKADVTAKQTLYVSEESQFIPALKCRLAVEEDNDDIIQMLDAESSLLRAFYGDYYVSEMMRHPDESRRVCVSQKVNSISGVLCLNRCLDLDRLNDKFELGTFAGLRKIKEDLDEASIDYEEEAEYWNRSGSSSSNDSPVESTREDPATCSKEPMLQSNNVFTIELLSFASDVDELRSQALLSAAFSCFPDLDYCAILLPTQQPYFPFLDDFTRVPPKANKDYPMALFVTHRMLTQHACFRVRRAHPVDYLEVSKLVQGMADAPYILHDFVETLKDEQENGHRSYVLSVDGIVVALAILCNETEEASLRHCYRVEDLVPTIEGATRRAAGRLLRLALMPIFNVRLSFFLAEIMRLADYAAIFHRATLERADDHSGSANMSACLSPMQPVEPRIRNWPQFQRFYQKAYANEDNLRFEELFALFVTTPILTMSSRQIVNDKIIVIGASECGLAFIDALALGFKNRDLHFADITLVSTNGLPYSYSKDYQIKMMTPFRGRYCHAYRCLTPAKASYNVVTGTVVAIDRKGRCVYIEDSGILMYDYLIITSGLMFEKPTFVSRLDNSNSTIQSCPNCYTVNDDFEAKFCLEEIKRLTEDFTVEKSIVFHGRNLECYCVLGAFLELGLEPSCITLIDPKPFNNDSNCYDDDSDGVDAFKVDPELKKVMLETMKAKGVRILEDCTLVNTMNEEDTGLVKYLVVENKLKESVFIYYDALISFHIKKLCFKTFLAIEEAGLVFDGRIIIDAQFRTNDWRIFAAGTITKYSRKLIRTESCDVCESMSRHFHSSVEVGEKLAENIVKIVTHRVDEDEDKNNRQKCWMCLEPRIIGCSYRKPIVTACLLVGGYRYLRVEKPGSQKTFSKMLAGVNVFTWGSYTADIGYFRLCLNEFRSFESITCFHKTDFDIQNIVALYGKHESIMDGILSSQDLFQFLHEPWTFAVFNDYFDEFRKKCHYTVVSTILGEPKYKHYSTDDYDCTSSEESSEENRLSELEQILSRMAKEDDHPVEIEDMLIGFIERHEDELPMYLTSRRKSRLIGEIEATATLYPNSVDYDEEEKENGQSCSEAVTVLQKIRRQ